MAEPTENQSKVEAYGDDALSFSPIDVTKASNELAVYNTATRAILLHLCQRLGWLETSFRTMQNDVFQMRSELSKGNKGIKDEVSDVHDQVQMLSARLNDIVDQFQNEINQHKTQVSTLTTSVQDERERLATLTTSVQDERERLAAVDEKVDNQHDEFDTRIQEINLKLDEIPRAFAALQNPRRDPFAGFTFLKAEGDKLSLGKHVDRTQTGQRKGGPPFTDLQPFTIPDDMKEKIEMKIRQKEASKSALDKRAATELADAYRRLQLAGYPRVTEIHMHVEQCREEIKQAFEFIRSSNLQLYACCESKVERIDLLSIQSELKALRNRVRDFETRGGGKQNQVPSPTCALGGTKVSVALSTWNLDKYFNLAVDMDSMNNSTVRVSAAQVPELRISLLEMAKNLHALRQQWLKTHVQPLNPIVKQHLEKLIALLHDGYSLTAVEPVDLEHLEAYVDKAARVLGSEFSQQVIRMMMMSEEYPDATGSDDVANALDRYARSFTEAVAGTSGSVATTKGSPTTQHAAIMRIITDQKKKLEQLRVELEKVVESQRNAESTVSACGNGSNVNTDTSSAVDTRFATQQQQLYGLQDQLILLHQQSRQQEEAHAELVRHFDLWKKERAPIGVVTGQRVAGGASSTQTIQHGLPLSAALRRNSSGIVNDLDAYLAITSVDQGDRPKSQTKLDPIHIQRVGNEASPTTGRSSVSVPVPVARNGVVHRIQARAQGMRPKSGVHHGDVNNP